MRAHVLALWVAGCYDPRVQPGSPCSTGADCPLELACVAGTCGGAGDAAAGSDATLRGPDSGSPDGRPIDGPPPPIDAPKFSARIDIDGTAYTGIDYAGTWAADPGVGGICDGMPFSGPTQTVNGTADSPLFVSQMFNSVLTCTIPNVPSGTYQVRLLFAELRLGGAPCVGLQPPARIFDIALEGTTVASQFDMTGTGGGCAAAGGSGHAFDETYTVAVTDGALDVVETASQGTAALNAIELVQQ